MHSICISHLSMNLRAAQTDVYRAELAETRVFSALLIA